MLSIKEMSPTMPLAHITLATRDVPGTQAFFAEVLGWLPIHKPGNIGRPAAWSEIAPGQELHIVEVPDFQPSPHEAEFGRHLAFAVPLEEFDGLKRRLLTHGAHVMPPIRQTPFERFFFRDPNGYVFEILAAERNPET
jgi:catechol 2,3-dioxygenase-like lactoylglutathione lyase family enzyme